MSDVYRESFESYLKEWAETASRGLNSLLEKQLASIKYSLLGGGKRFRPVLALQLAEGFGVPPQRVLPWAAAIEMVHTYSLIHDDLPCMDNDSERRGQPTNHIVFGESAALLAGDTLLTEAFGCIATGYRSQPEVVTELILIFVEALGLNGMASGQAMDLASKNQVLQFDDLVDMQKKKTGALIRVTAEGVACLSGLTIEKRKLCREFGDALGFAFQLKDDLLDSQTTIEKGSFPDLLGLEGTQNLLNETSQAARDCLIQLGLSQGPLGQLIKHNESREF